MGTDNDPNMINGRLVCTCIFLDLSTSSPLTFVPNVGIRSTVAADE